MAHVNLRRFAKDNGLTIFMFGLFFVFMVCLSVAGVVHENQELSEHDQPPISYLEYITSGGFAEAVFENWESEFLQMALLVVATVFLKQKGAADSKERVSKLPIDTSSRHALLHGLLSHRSKELGRFIYANSLSLALILIFLLSFVGHAAGGTAQFNQEAMLHGEPTLSVLNYITTSQFWFESFQNWQSEFLAVGALLFLSIYLRQHGSTESKPVNASNATTGK